MKLGYICTNFNNSHFTANAVRSLVESAGNVNELHIVIVDNLSSAKDRVELKKIKDTYSCVDLVLNEENIGYFQGLNTGIRHLRQLHPAVEYIVIGNNDLIFPQSFCSDVQNQIPLLHEYAVVSPDIVTLDGVHQNPHVINKISKFREFVYDIYYLNYLLAQIILRVARVTKIFTDRTDELQYKIPQPIYQGHGSCYLIGPKFFKHFTEFWAPTFLMGEEYFLSKQLSDHDLQCYYTPNINLTHCCNGSLRDVPNYKVWQLARDAHKVYRKYVKVIW